MPGDDALGRKMPKAGRLIQPDRSHELSIRLKVESVGACRPCFCNSLFQKTASAAIPLRRFRDGHLGNLKLAWSHCQQSAAAIGWPPRTARKILPPQSRNRFPGIGKRRRDYKRTDRQSRVKLRVRCRKKSKAQKRQRAGQGFQRALSSCPLSAWMI